MSNARKNSQPKFAYTPTTDLPDLGTFSTTWDLAGLYYASERDPKLEADVATTEAAYAAFRRRWQKQPFTTDAEVLARALRDYEALSAMPETSRPQRYLGLRLALDTNDAAADKLSALISRRLRTAGEQVLFFGLALGKIPKKEQRTLLKNPVLKPYRYYLERLFLGAQHHLTEPEEKIIRLKARQASAMWADMTEKLVSNRKITYGKKQLLIPEALETIDTLESTEKPKLWRAITAELKELGEVAEHELNAIITDARTEDERRGYQKPYSATALGYEDTEASIESLVSTVSSSGFALSRKFYEAKARFHGVAALDYSQKYDSIGSDVTIPFEQAVAICRDVFYGVKHEYGTLFDTMLSRGQIDVYPKPGKRGGAFMSAEIGHPTHVFLNHLPTFKSLETLAHEMGHAIHAERSKSQPPLYEGHSITTAETASTLFENLVFDAVYAQAEEADKIVLLHDRITRDIATIERQIAFFNAELEMHTRVHQEGSLTNDEYRDIMFRHLSSYLGKGVALRPEDGYSYVYIPHLRYGFYVYTYTFGILMSTAMSARYREDRSYVKEIDHFLSAGASNTVANIFKSIGFDTTHPDTWKLALERHEVDINTFAAHARAHQKKLLK